MNKKISLGGSLAFLLVLGAGCVSPKPQPATIKNTFEQTPVDENESGKSASTTTQSALIVTTTQPAQSAPKPTSSPNPTPAPAPTPTLTPTPTVKSFTMTAKEWEFSPGTITVKKGDTVKLTITSVDVNHGFKLPDFNVTANLIPGQTVTVQFVADKAGTFTFFCNVFCGEGHREMRGTLIVE